MTLFVKPTAFLKGSFVLPSSKSYSIRAFLIAACGGRSTIHGASDCDDARVALRVAKQLGAKIKHLPSGDFTVNAVNSRIKNTSFNVGESGTVLRLLLPILTLLPLRSIVKGEGTLKSRPNKFLIDTLRRMGANISGRGSLQTVPIVIKGGHLNAGKVVIDGSLSSQFISALLMAAPKLCQDTQLNLRGKNIVSETYITMTRQILKKAGIKISKRGSHSYFIGGRQTYQGLRSFTIPSDYGLAAFFLAAAGLVRSNIQLKGSFDDRLIQADGAILNLLQKMGLTIKKSKSMLSVLGPFALKGGSFSLKDCPDLVPIVSVLALFAKGPTRLYGIGHARIKESNRISDLRQELEKIGAKIKEGSSEMTVIPQSQYRQNIILDPHHDHRLAMAFSILGLKVGVRIKDIECVCKSYPNFVRDLKKIGAKVSKA